MTAYDAVIVGSGPTASPPRPGWPPPAPVSWSWNAPSTWAAGPARPTAGSPGSPTTSARPSTRSARLAAFAALGLQDHGLRWLHPPVALAHPFDDGSAAVLDRDLDATATGLGDDADAYRRLIGPHVDHWDDLLDSLLGPVLSVPAHPLAMARFGLIGRSRSRSSPAASAPKRPGPSSAAWLPIRCNR